VTDHPHARAFDLPNWPTPPRVRDIPTTPGSWGAVRACATEPGAAGAGAVYQDEDGMLWADGQTVPQFKKFAQVELQWGAYLYWTEHGLGLYLPFEAYPNMGKLPSEALAAEPARWIPVAVVAQELPEFARPRG
jgi:hypothetical protein